MGEDTNPSNDPSQRLIPTFSCIVYLRRVEDGQFSGRVANLTGIEATGDTERDVLSKIVPAFKSRAAEYVARNERVPLVEPVPEPQPGEQKRFIPVHL